jgi:hypothetical protein
MHGETMNEEGICGRVKKKILLQFIKHGNDLSRTHESFVICNIKIMLDPKVFNDEFIFTNVIILFRLTVA